jgi:hypothetical protein
MKEGQQNFDGIILNIWYFITIKDWKDENEFYAINTECSL